MPPIYSAFHEDDIRPTLPLPPSVHLPSLPPYQLQGMDQLPPGKVHAIFNYFLRDYQRSGVRFIWDRVGRGGGGVLCDDMGLGKTVQVIAFLSALFNKEGNSEDKRRIRELKTGDRKVQPVLVVCPSSVLCNWEEELRTWGHFAVVRFHKGEKEEALRIAKKGSIEVVLTTFDTARQHREELNMVDWKMMVVDECHKIKELQSGITRAMKAFSCQVRIGLTGTALQNKYEELWCLLDWANPGCLGSVKHFQAEFSSPMTKGFRLDATKAELATARLKQVKLNSLKQAWMIRRTKDGVISDQLPKKTDQVVFCGLSKFQMSVFSYLLSHPNTKLVLTAWERCTCGKKLPRSRCCYRSGPQPQALLFQLMHVFLKVANHAALLLPRSTNSIAQAKLGEEICRAAAEKHPELRERSFLQLSDPKYSGKMEVLAGLLTVLESENAKVLLFSYSTRLLDILEAYISSKGYTHCRLDGSTKADRRQQMVKEFNTDPSIFIFLLSTKAGGLGLNITGANTVIIFDPNWNPSHDLQAQDRAYRLGQTQDVRVYRLVSAGCIEEIIYLRQLYKQQLAAASVDGCTAKRYFRAVQGDSRRKGELFGIKNLLRVTRPGDRACLTEDIEKRNKVMEGKVRGKSKVELAIHAYELEEHVEKDGEKDDPFCIGLDSELGGGGVVYAHVNQDVVGGSREEEHISNCAQRELENGQGWQPAEECEELTNTQAVLDGTIKQETDKYNPGSAGDNVRVHEAEDRVIIYGETPVKERMQLFLKMAKKLGVEKTELARRVVGMSWIERLDLLRETDGVEGGKLLGEALVAHKEEEKELMLRHVSYNNVGNKRIIAGKKRSSIRQGDLAPGQTSGIKHQSKVQRTLPRDPFSSDSDDESLLTALVQDAPKSRSATTTVDDGDDFGKVLKTAPTPSSLISLPKDSLAQCSPMPLSSSLPSVPTKAVKPAPPGVTFKRRRVDCIGTNTDTLNSIFNPGNQESSCEDEYSTWSRRKERSNLSENIFSGLNDCDKEVRMFEQEKKNKPVRETRDLKNNTSIDLIFPENNKEGEERVNLDSYKRVNQKEEGRRRVFLEPVLDNLETIDDIFG